MTVPRLQLTETPSDSVVRVGGGGGGGGPEAEAPPAPSVESSSMSAGPLAAADSSLTVESSLPDGMGMSSELSGGPSGLTTGYSLQSLIRGAVTRFADE